ncbi:MAG: hypothetical protein OHK0024_21430 [Thalassobaculales bacterium]
MTAQAESGFQVDLTYIPEASQNVTPPGSLAGTLEAGAVIDGAVAEGASVLAIAGGGNARSILKGDRFTVAGVAGEYRFTAASLTTETGAVAAAAFAPAAPAGGFPDGAAITLVARPAMKVLRLTSRSINAKRGQLRSEEVQAHGQTTVLRHGLRQVQGSLGFQLSRGDHDELLAWCCGADWQAGGSTAATTLSAVAAVDGQAARFSRATGSFLADGHRPGDFVAVSGFSSAANNGLFLVKAATATALEVFGPLAAETGSGDEAIAGPARRLALANRGRTWTIERRFNGVGLYQLFTGVAASQFRIEVQPEQIVSGSVELIGLAGGEFAGASVNAEAAPPTTNDPFDAFNGEVYVGDRTIGCCTGLSLAVALNRQAPGVVGSPDSPRLFESQMEVSGQIGAFFEDRRLHDLFWNEETFGLGLRLEDPNGSDWIGLYLPRCKVVDSQIDPPQSGPVPQQLQIQALYDPALGSTLAITRSYT